MIDKAVEKMWWRHATSLSGEEMSRGERVCR